MQTSHSLLLFACSRLSVVEKVMLPRETDVIEIPRFFLLHTAMLAPKDFSPEMLHPLTKNDYDWHPERSPEGPITIVISSADKAMYVYRNGDPIGRASIEIGGKGLTGREKLGNHVRWQQFIVAGKSGYFGQTA